MTEDKIIELADLYKIFCDSTRLKILIALIDEELCVNDIANKINSTQSATSHQLRILKQSKLVKNKKVGQTTYYSLSDDHVKKIIKIGSEHINEA